MKSLHLVPQDVGVPHQLVAHAVVVKVPTRHGGPRAVDEESLAALDA